MTRSTIITVVVVFLALIAVSFGYSCTATQTDISKDLSDDAQRDPVVLRRGRIESEYPKFKDFENQRSFAGQSVKSEVDDGDYYFAYIVHGSGLPIAQATCFRVDRVGGVFQTGLVPDPVDSYAGYRDINPRNCRGIK